MKKLLTLTFLASIGIVTMPGCSVPGFGWLDSLLGKKNTAPSEQVIGPQVSRVKEIHSEAEFTQLISNSDKLTVVKFGAPWCGACKQMAPDFEAAANTAGDQFVFTDLNIDKVPGIADQYGISGIPTVLIYKSGQEVGPSDRAERTGYVSQEKLLKLIRKYL